MSLPFCFSFVTLLCFFSLSPFLFPFCACFTLSPRAFLRFVTVFPVSFLTFLCFALFPRFCIRFAPVLLTLRLPFSVSFLCFTFFPRFCSRFVLLRFLVCPAVPVCMIFVPLFQLVPSACLPFVHSFHPVYTFLCISLFLGACLRFVPFFHLVSPGHRFLRFCFRLPLYNRHFLFYFLPEWEARHDLWVCVYKFPINIE